MTVLQIQGFDGGYSGMAVVRGLDLTVNAGEIVALLGSNGAGEDNNAASAVSGFLPVIRGDIKVFGESIRGKRPHSVARTGLAYVPDYRGLFFQLTAEENIEASARASGRPDFPAIGSSRFSRRMKRYLGVKCGVLSGGEQQAVALARALASEPRMLMVDEMTYGPVSDEIVKDMFPDPPDDR